MRKSVAQIATFVFGLCAIAVAIAYLLFGSITDNKWGYARAQLRSLGYKVESFKRDTGKFPETLDALMNLDSAPGTLGPYVRPPELTDPWGRPFYYRQDVSERGFVLFSLGADGMIGGAGQDRDIAAEPRVDDPLRVTSAVKWRGGPSLFLLTCTNPREQYRRP